MTNNVISKDQLRGMSILLVDDQQSNIKLLTRMLSSDGYTNVFSTTSPREASDLYIKHECELLVLDLNMPEMDGFEVMQEMQERFADDEKPTILVLTAQADTSSRLRALESGAQDYVTKPFNYPELLSRINNMLERRVLYRALKDQNEYLEAQVRARVEEINDTRLEIIRRLGRAAEYRDNETGLHIIRMSNFSTMLAEEVGVSSVQCELILNASPMHDIGKIGIPDNVLLKPGKLDADEWAIMKSHAQIGANLLSGHDSELMTMACQIALTHHEKWDGSGYPNSLAGEDIPLTGRIVAVADVFDALTSERPYKKAWTVEEAMATINEGRGSHFEPRLVDGFNKVLPDVLEIKERYREPT